MKSEDFKYHEITRESGNSFKLVTARGINPELEVASDKYQLSLTVDIERHPTYGNVINTAQAVADLEAASDYLATLAKTLQD